MGRKPVSPLGHIVLRLSSPSTADPTTQVLHSIVGRVGLTGRCFGSLKVRWKMRNLFPGAVAVGAVLYANASLAQMPACPTAPVVQGGAAVTLLDNGDPSNHVDIVFMAEGYTANGMTSFANTVDAMITAVFNLEPMKEYRNYFNIHRLNTLSNVSGVTGPPARDTAFGALFFPPNGIVLQGTESLARRILDCYMGPNRQDIAIIVANNDTPNAGNGGFPALVSRAGALGRLIAHEAFGHQFSHLADEYFGSGTPSACLTEVLFQPNIQRYVGPDQSVPRDQIMWAHWIDSTTQIPTPGGTPNLPGFYRGGHYCHDYLFRPTGNSIMRDNITVSSFDSPNQETVLKAIYSRVSPINIVTPPAGQVRTSDRRPLQLTVAPMQPATHSLGTIWTADGVGPIGTGSTVSIGWPAFQRGTTAIHADVIDTTPWVRKSDGLLEDRASWNVEIICAGDCTDDEFSDPTVLDIVRSVNVLLGKAPLSSCDRADVNADGAVMADEVREILKNTGCGCGDHECQQRTASSGNLSLTSSLAAAASIDVGSVSGAKGQTVQVPISLSGGFGVPTALQLDVQFDPSILGVTNGDSACVISGDLAEYSASTHLVGNGVLRILVADTNLNGVEVGIRDGVVVTCGFLISATTTAASTPVSGNRQQVVGSGFDVLQSSVTAGTVTIAACAGCGCPASGAMALGGATSTTDLSAGSTIWIGASEIERRSRAEGVGPRRTVTVELGGLEAQAGIGGNVAIRGPLAALGGRDLVIQWQPYLGGVRGRVLDLSGTTLAEFDGTQGRNGRVTGTVRTVSGETAEWSWGTGR